MESTLINYLYDHQDNFFNDSLTIGRIIKNNNINFEFEGYSKFLDSLIDCNENDYNDLFDTCKKTNIWLSFFMELQNAITMLISDKDAIFKQNSNNVLNRTELKMLKMYIEKVKTQYRIISEINRQLFIKYQKVDMALI